MFLIEFEEKNSVEKLLLYGARVNTSAMPVRSPFLSHECLPSLVKEDEEEVKINSLEEYMGVNIIKNKSISEEKLLEKLITCNSVSI